MCGTLTVLDSNSPNTHRRDSPSTAAPPAATTTATTRDTRIIILLSSNTYSNTRSYMLKNECEAARKRQKQTRFFSFKSQGHARKTSGHGTWSISIVRSLTCNVSESLSPLTTSSRHCQLLGALGTPGTPAPSAAILCSIFSPSSNTNLFCSNGTVKNASSAWAKTFREVLAFRWW